MKLGDPSSVEDRPDHTPLAIQSFARARCIGLAELQNYFLISKSLSDSLNPPIASSPQIELKY